MHLQSNVTLQLMMSTNQILGDSEEESGEFEEGPQIHSLSEEKLCETHYIQNNDAIPKAGNI